MSQALDHQLATVVVIDDTPDLRLLLRLVLETSDRYTVVGEAGDGAAGIEMVREWQPDLVLLDLAMPIMDGLEALPGIHNVCPQTEVVVLSGFEAERMASQAIERGAAGYLQKGTSPDDIIDALDEILGRPKGPRVVRPTPADPQAAAAEAEALRSAFATAAHELRTPATVLIGLARVLTRRRSQLDPAKIDELLDAVIRQTMVLDRITADMLASAQAARGGLEAQIESMDVVAVAHAAALSMSADADISIEAPVSLTVRADPVRVQQMFTNLLTNAVKYAEPPFSIRIDSDASDALIRVEDHGAGVPAAFQAKLFEQYTRAEASRAAGTGLGLYVVKSLAEAQGGDAWYEPRDGGGSRFCFRLPLA